MAAIVDPMAVAARSIAARPDGTPDRMAGAASAIGKLAAIGEVPGRAGRRMLKKR